MPVSPGRPRLHLPPTPADHLLNGLAFAALIALLVVPFAYYGHLPDRILTHFGLDGQPDAWGGKKRLFIMPAIGLTVFVLLTFVNRRPHKFNYLTQITPENAERQYRNATLMIRVLRLLQLLLFLAFTWAAIRAATGQNEIPAGNFVLATVAGVSGAMLFFVFRSVLMK